jgi:predicted GIY-YIG superfamily endonuclease
MYVYLLQSNKKTYIGATVNLQRRLRQHNREIKGGAKYTTSKKGLGTWDYHGFILGLDKSTALSIEDRKSVV